MDWYTVGKVVNTHGLYGEVRVVVVTDFPELRFKVGGKVYALDEELTISSMRQHKNFYLLKFDGFENIHVVERFKGIDLKVSRAQQQTLDDHEFYYHEVIGCMVFTDDGERLGTVTDIYAPGANDVWAIKRTDGSEVLIPYIEDVVQSVDVENKKVVIRVMEGLLDV